MQGIQLCYPLFQGEIRATYHPRSCAQASLLLMEVSASEQWDPITSCFSCYVSQTQIGKIIFFYLVTCLVHFSGSFCQRVFSETDETFSGLIGMLFRCAEPM